jgi:hypothetical protein
MPEPGKRRLLLLADRSVDFPKFAIFDRHEYTTPFRPFGQKVANEPARGLKIATALLLGVIGSRSNPRKGN